MRTSNKFFIILLLSTVACSAHQTHIPETATVDQALDSIVENIMPLETEEISSTEKILATETEISTATETDVLNIFTPGTILVNGQIMYVSKGNLWRYLVETQENTQLTFDDNTGNQNLQISFDGKWLAINKGQEILIYHLDDMKTIQIAGQGNFMSWSDDSQEIFTVKQNLSCEELEDFVEDQDQINFDIFRINLNDIENAQLIANISGGLRIPQTISKDGTWMSFLNCRCYSECSGHSLWHLPNSTEQIHPEVGLSAGMFSFSPNFDLVAFSREREMGLPGSPLYVSAIDYSSTTSIFDEPNSGIDKPEFSPDGNWIAFNFHSFNEEGMRVVNSKVMIVRPDGSEWLSVGGDFSYVVDWSPIGDQLLFYQKEEDSVLYYVYNVNTGENILLPIVFESADLLDWGIFLNTDLP